MTIKNKVQKIKLLTLLLILSACGNRSDDSSKFVQPDFIQDSSSTLLQALEADYTGINFQNKIEETPEYNYFSYMHIYMGAGVAAADFNNDGLEDIFFVSNLFQDKLYLNKGNLTFEDISEKAGIAKEANTFSTGVNVIDINNDGFMDIYLCRSGPFQTGDARLANQLFVNNGDLTFTEKAKEYGLDEKSHSTQSLFLDYDRDGDLDMYLVNTPIEFKLTNVAAQRELVANDPKVQQLGSSDKLLNNSNGVFVDVSREAKMFPEISFGLNAIVCDINNDNYPDIHVSNDFIGPDFLYENQKDGTFREVAIERLKHTSYFSMGSDVSDINNDGNLDLMVLDMSFKDYKKSKTSMNMSDRDDFRRNIKLKHNYQYVHNMLHLGNGQGGFSEVSQLAGVDKTDWSWSSLFIDFDHDGLKDLYVTNGIKRNVLDQDGMRKLSREVQQFNESGDQLTQDKIDHFINLLPESDMTNHIFKNRDGLKFDSKDKVWITEGSGISQGAAYADFDNDGDIDIVMNNTNKPATVLKNLSSEKQKGNAVVIQLRNKETKNRLGIGATVELEINGEKQKQLILSNRGYFSASQSIAHFGLGTAEKVDRIKIIWPNGKGQTILNVEANQKLLIDYLPDTIQEAEAPAKTLFTSSKQKLRRLYNHRDAYFDDYQVQVLIPHRLSSYGPKLVKGDLNNDGSNDIYIPGGYQQSGGVYYQTGNEFNPSEINGYSNEEKEETSGAIADFNGDGYNDLYVGCGSYQFDKSAEVADYLLFGSANGTFTNATNRIPLINTNTSTVLPFDYDQDGDMDLFIGSRVVSAAYPLAPRNYILQNNKGSFIDVTKSVAPEIEYFGMVTDADWKLENNTIQLAVVGEWTGIGLFDFDGTKFNQLSNNISTKYGWWNAIKYADLDNDGDQDIVAGNLGLNYKFHASEEKPFQLFYGDLDSNGTQEIILAKEINGSLFPVRGKQCSTEQLPIVSEKFPSFNAFANQDLKGLYGKALEGAKQYKATMFETAVFINQGKDFEVRLLPYEAQFSTVNGIIVKDINKDGNSDLILAGNMYESEIETTKADASKGVVLINDGKANFTTLSSRQSGFIAERNAKDLQFLEGEQEDFIFVGNNNGAIELFSTVKPLP